MLNKQDAIEIIETSLNEIKNKKIQERKEITLLEKCFAHKNICVLTGIRRSGKTYLLFQLIKQLLEKKENVVYVNFENPRFDNKVAQLDVLYTTFLEHREHEGRAYFFLDEIQNIDKWEKWLAIMYEKEIKFFVSGSNASLLGGEFSKSLSGRHRLIKIYPLDFKQFLSFKDADLLERKERNVIENKAKIIRYFNEYLKFGGFPEVVYNQNKEILKNYFDDIISKDIISRHNIKFKQSLKEVAFLLLTNISSRHSLYSLNKVIQARSINTIKNYLMYLEEAYLILKVPFFSFSVKKQLSNPFKIYALDTGMRNAISFKFSDDIGKIYENVVAVELIRRHDKENVFYWKSSKQEEVDFVIRQGIRTNQLIQVCYDLKDEKIKNREIKPLLLGAKELKCKDLLVLNEDYEAIEQQKGIKVKFLPLWKWLLEES